MDCLAEVQSLYLEGNVMVAGDLYYKHAVQETPEQPWLRDLLTKYEKIERLRTALSTQEGWQVVREENGITVLMQTNMRVVEEEMKDASAISTAEAEGSTAEDTSTADVEEGRSTAETDENTSLPTEGNKVVENPSENHLRKQSSSSASHDRHSVRQFVRNSLNLDYT